MPTPVPGTLPGRALRQALSRRFGRIVVFSGAGMSADSGIPTFRSGDQGLWQAFDPAKLATPAGWHADPALVWGWYEWRRAQVAAAMPNPGHLAVARLQDALGARVVTQNVDDLHERAGVDGVLHLHGSLSTPRCSQCGDPHPPPPVVEAPRRRREPPGCAGCGGRVRPGVVWFGEPLDQAVLAEAARRIAACDLLLVVGTSGVVQPAASLVDLAPSGAVVVEVNPEPPGPGRRPLHHLATTAAHGLPLLAAWLLQPAAPEDTSAGAWRPRCRAQPASAGAAPIASLCTPATARPDGSAMLAKLASQAMAAGEEQAMDLPPGTVSAAAGLGKKRSNTDR